MATPLRLQADKLKRASQMMRTVSHPKRLALVELLLETGPQTVTQLAEALDISQSNTSQHLKGLEQVGLLAGERQGKEVYYCVQNNHLKHMLACIRDCVDC
ncbi:MAG: metalloregulator ArsR/SmtB family transcription factor [Bacteroidota bacterium]